MSIIKTRAKGDKDMKPTLKKEKAATAEDSEVLSLVDEWAEGVRTKNVERIVQHYSEDAVLFDLAPPLTYVGKEAYRKSLENWFTSFDGPIGYEFTDLEVNVSGDVAFVHSVNHMTGKRTGGEQTDVWLRATVGFRKLGGRWLVTHEHVSVPFYMDGSNKAAVDLKP